jgi:hypothetical protein
MSMSEMRRARERRGERRERERERAKVMITGMESMDLLQKNIYK